MFDRDIGGEDDTNHTTAQRPLSTRHQSIIPICMALKSRGEGGSSPIPGVRGFPRIPFFPGRGGGGNKPFSFIGQPKGSFKKSAFDLRESAALPRTNVDTIRRQLTSHPSLL